MGGGQAVFDTRPPRALRPNPGSNRPVTRRSGSGRMGPPQGCPIHALPDRYASDAELIGGGRLCLVYRVTDHLDGAPVALAVLRPEHAADPIVAARWGRELERTRNIRHPALAARVDQGRTPDGLPFVASVLAAETFAALHRAPPSWERIRALVERVVSGLACLHAHGRVHGNLKPEDLLLFGDDDVRITDLHVGAVLGALAGRADPPGSGAHAAPEQRGAATDPIGRAVDLYALGVLLWDLVTGAPPPAQVAPVFAPRIDVPPALALLLANLLAPDPARRYDLAADVLTELRALDGASGGRREGTVAPGFAVPSAPVEDDASLRGGPPADEVLPGAMWNRPVPAPLPADRPGELWDAARRAAAGRVEVLLVSGPRAVDAARHVRSFLRELEQGGWAESVVATYGRGTADEGMAGALRALLGAERGDRGALVARARRKFVRERGTEWHELTSDAEAVASWCGPLLAREAPPPASIVERELFAHLEARGWRGLSVLAWVDVELAEAEDPLGVARRCLDLAAEEWRGGGLLLVLTSADPGALDAARAGAWSGLAEAGARAVLAPLDRTADDPRPLRPPTASRRYVDTEHLLALAGRSAPVELVREMAGDPLADVLLADGPWTEEGDEVVFADLDRYDALVREAEARPDAAYLHRRLARRWATRWAHRDHGLRAAVHAAAAGDGELARAAIGQLSERALAASVPALARRAGALAPALAEGPERDLVVARASDASGRFAEAAEGYDRARAGFEAVGDRERALHAGASGGWARFRVGDLERASARFEEVLRTAAIGRESAAEADARAGIASVLERRLDFGGAAAAWSALIERFAREPRQAARGLFGEAEIARWTGRYEEAADLYAAAGAAWRDGRDPLGELRAARQRGVALGHLRGLADADRRWLDHLRRALTLGSAADWAIAWLEAGDAARHREDLPLAERRYERAAAWVDSTCDPDVSARLALGAAQIALSRGDLDGAYPHTVRAAEALARAPGHRTWAVYRAVVAALLARRRDHTGTSQWLWSAQEAGLRHFADRDAASALVTTFAAAAEAGWGNVLRLAGPLGVEQLTRLRDPRGASALQQRLATALL